MTASIHTRFRNMIRITQPLMHGLILASAGVAGACAATDSDLTEAQKAAIEVAERRIAGARTDGGFQLQSIEAKQWPDSSLGCPQRGMSYMQVITDGYLVKLARDGKLHEVRVAGENAVICPGQVSGTARAPRPAARVTNLDVMERDAIADLAQRLQAQPDSIRIARRIPQRWPDESLACDASAATSTKEGPVAGFRLMLEHDGRLYSYHTDLKRVLPCPPIESR